MEVKRTPRQEQILKLLKQLAQEISAQGVYLELRNHRQGIGLATVYRTLEALKLEGVVQARTLPNGTAVYSLIQEDKHHLTCLQFRNYLVAFTTYVTTALTCGMSVGAGIATVILAILLHPFI